MAASASNTGIPSAANSLAVSLLPMPIPPVRPITKGLLALTQHPFQLRAQARCNLRSPAEKCLERRHGLVHQHAQAINGLVAARASVFQELCLQRIVDDVAYRGGLVQRREVEVQRRIAP